MLCHFRFDNHFANDSSISKKRSLIKTRRDFKNPLAHDSIYIEKKEVHEGTNEII